MKKSKVMNTLSIQTNVNILNYPAGFIVTVECDADGIPLDSFWRKRLRDSEIDNCCEILTAKPSKTKNEDTNDRI